ncbi:MAG: hypothetical protein Wins2KO_01320 [Winogradskyella sp.]
MKKIFTICLVSLLLACGNEEPKIDYALFSGKIENPTGEVITIYKGRDMVKEITLNDDNTFADTLKIEKGYYTLNHGREGSAIYLVPGNSIQLTLNTEEFDETLTYTGLGSENSNFLAKKFLNEEHMDIDIPKIYSMEEGEFLAMMDEIKSSKLEFLNAAKSIDPEFRILEEKAIEYEHLSNLIRYPDYHKYFTKKEEFSVSNDFNNRISGIDLSNEEDYKNIENYKVLVLNSYSNDIRKSDSPKDVFDKISIEVSQTVKDDIAENLAYDVNLNNEHHEAFYKGIMAMSTDSLLKVNLTTKYEKLQNLALGMPSPKFFDYENHKGGTTSLDDLKGKYVYVDVWATWCGPCIREIPSLKEVEKEFHDKNIEFVSMSIDRMTDHDKWVAMVNDKELGGTQIMADKDWKSDFVQGYAIEGIPRFILIDPNGNIVSADAPRPSNPKLKELFNGQDI